MSESKGGEGKHADHVEGKVSAAGDELPKGTPLSAVVNADAASDKEAAEAIIFATLEKLEDMLYEPYVDPDTGEVWNAGSGGGGGGGGNAWEESSDEEDDGRGGGAAGTAGAAGADAGATGGGGGGSSFRDALADFEERAAEHFADEAASGPDAAGGAKSGGLQMQGHLQATKWGPAPLKPAAPEYKLVYTDLYNEYRRLVESHMERFLDAQGFDVHSFVEAIRAAAGVADIVDAPKRAARALYEGGATTPPSVASWAREGAHEILTLLAEVDDFETFVAEQRRKARTRLRRARAKK